MKKILDKNELWSKKIRRSAEKLKYIEKKTTFSKNSLQNGLQERKNDKDFSVLPKQTQQLSELNNSEEVTRNCRIVSDEYVRELMKKYDREIRRG